MIPKAFQDDFNYSLDVPANIIAVCPNCHRRLHHTKMSQIAEVVQQIYSDRPTALRQADTFVPVDKLLNYYRLDS